MVRTRIAPSPTGYLHIGTARTALFNYLFAKKQGGTFVLRIEDTDIERGDKAFEADIFESLERLGIKADEGPEGGGEYGPYRQSERIASYTPYLEKLLAQGNAYHCPHSEIELEAERKSLLASGKPPLHACEYRDGKGKANGIIRFKTPAGRTITFPDLIRGEIRFESDLIGDFSIAKDLKAPLYNFAVVIDDHEMQISHVIRGEDHISNTPKQMLIQEALGLPQPAYAHLPLILGPDRSKLSKRHGATSIREFREEGYLPEAIVNFMALLGWNPGGERELLSLDELVREFDLAKVQKSGAVFNIEKLDWMNGEYIRKKDTAELARIVKPYLGEAATAPEGYLERVVALEQPRMKRISDIKEAAYFFQPPEYPKELLRWKNMTDAGVVEALGLAWRLLQAIPEADFNNKEGLESAFLNEIGSGDKGEILWPLRVALTGKKASPGPFEIMAVLGKERTSQCLYRTFRLFKEKPPADRHG